MVKISDVTFYNRERDKTSTLPTLWLVSYCILTLKPVIAVLYISFRMLEEGHRVTKENVRENERKIEKGSSYVYLSSDQSRTRF